MDADAYAIILTQLFGVVYILFAFILGKSFRKLGDRMRTLNSTDMSLENCYSVRWLMKSLRRRIIEPKAFMSLAIGLSSMLLALTVLTVFAGVGYGMFIVLIGIAILHSGEVSDVYSYSRAILKPRLEELGRKDVEYIKTAREFLKLSVMRFLIVGAIFIVAAPFVPAILDCLVYGIALYARIMFYATEMALQVSMALALLIMFALPAILTYLPEFVLRKILHRPAPKRIR